MKHCLLLAILHFCAWRLFALEQECPHPEDSYPCYCEEDEDRTTMHCNYLQDNKQIRDGLGRLTDYKISTVSIWMFDTGVIKSDAFKGPHINEIVFSHSTVNMESPPFLGQENSLSRLTFLSCFDEEDLVGSYSLGHLNSLKEISFEKNDIKVLKNDWITSSGPILRSVTFDNCKIERMEDKVFSKLTSLTTIFLMDNKITSISRSMFPMPAENLRSISMNDNNIESLPDDIFKDMPSLRTVELERNNLKTLSQGAWGKIIENLSRVYLEDNPIRCDIDLKWISKKVLPKTFTGTCSEPAKLKNKPIRVLTPADFH
ncbi:slit homolog 1 protein-like [Argiope bruennichi]|uniref:Slit protein like n=1 Tax=Argiope bruennichi TaxID=94029 RepID=A0A8T0FQ90_ARGBR|nr:slit homolog 1 protein-like [Argiope bruennichi]KAF8791630.1 Slit protein like [Argiope bruennichi]